MSNHQITLLAITDQSASPMAGSCGCGPACQCGPACACNAASRCNPACTCDQ